VSSQVDHPVVIALPPAGQPGRFEGGYTDLFELICPDCGDHSYLDYSEVPSRLQWLRGPRPLEAALAAYHKHIGQACGVG